MAKAMKAMKAMKAVKEANSAAGAPAPAIKTVKAMKDCMSFGLGGGWARSRATAHRKSQRVFQCLGWVRSRATAHKKSRRVFQCLGGARSRATALTRNNMQDIPRKRASGARTKPRGKRPPSHSNRLKVVWTKASGPRPSRESLKEQRVEYAQYVCRVYADRPKELVVISEDI